MGSGIRQQGFFFRKIIHNMVTPTQLPVLSFLSTFPLFHHVTWLLSSFQECWRLTASRDPWCLSAPHQSSPPPLSSNIRWSNSYTGPRGPGKTSSPWQHRATWLQARTVAAGAWGTTQRLLTHKKNYICKRQPCNGTPGSHMSFISSRCRAAALDCESESSGNSHQSLPEVPSAQLLSCEGWFTF